MTRHFPVLMAIAALPLAAQYKAPRTPEGVPDLQGVYLNRTNVPLERPQNLGDREVYTPEELAERQRAAAEREARQAANAQNEAHYDSQQFGLDAATSGMVDSARTSLITGKTGRIPAMLPAAQQRVNDQQAARRGHEFDGPENRSMSERCILWSFEGPPVMPGGYNPNLQIHQGYGFVAVRYEMMGGARIIPTDGRPHADSGVRLWYGDSVGRWEGDTLVVETTNFNDQPALGRGADRNLRVVERFTRTAPDTITYKFTVTDPTVWEESWSGEYNIERIDGQVYEYGCQEGNYGMSNILSGARVAEREAASK
jgi:hypothetical protein